MLNNLRLSLRMLGKSPGFTAIAVLMLALGIGANTTIFSIINTILVKPIKAAHPEQLVGIYQHDQDDPGAFSFFSYPDFADLRSGKETAFTDLFAFGVASVGLQGELTDRVSASLVSANYFAALGVAPMLGRTFLPEEETSGTPVAVLTHSFWLKLGADPSIIGRKLKLTRGEVTVVGVMPRGFSGAQLLAPGMLLPLGMVDMVTASPGQPAPQTLTSRSDRRFMVEGRLKPGLTLANVGAALAALNNQFPTADPAERKARTLVCTAPSRFNFSNVPDRVGRGLAPVAGFAFGLSTLVLCIACLNLANMMLARGAARRKEVAIRLALGAGRSRILGQLLVEGLILALLGGVAGLLVSVWATHLLSAFIYSGGGMPADFPRFDLSPDWRVLVTLLALSGLATLFFALGPAWKLARLDVNSDLKRHAGEDAQERKGGFGARECLAVGQMGCALALLVAAALFSRSAINAGSATPGFEFGSNFYLALDSSLSGFPEARMRDLIRAAIERLSTLPGVESVSAALTIPFGNSNWGRGVQLAGAPPAGRGATTLAEGKEIEAAYNVVGADYFRTLGLPLRRGREFERREVEFSQVPRVAIISQNLADQLWPGEDALGRSIQFPAYNRGEAPTVMTVVGIVPEVRARLFDKRPIGGVYVPLGQDFQPSLNLHVRVAPGVNVTGLMIAARDELRRLDPQIPLTDVKTLQALHREGPTLRVVRLGSGLFGAFGFLAMVLSLLGIYGLKAYAVARRTREIGIRMALGASARDVVSMILRETAWLAGVGLALGLLVALGVAKFAAGFLYEVRGIDPLTFGVIPPLLFVMSLLACSIPARRAATVEPTVALRHE